MSRYKRTTAGRPTSIRLEASEKVVVFALALGLLLSGVGWLLLEHFVRIKSDFGPAHHPVQPWLLTAHGVLGMAAVWGFGVLWAFHVRSAWQIRRHRLSGGSVFAGMTILLCSGLLLYYAGNDTLRSWASLVHWVVGLAAGVGLVVHALIVPWRERRYAGHHEVLP
jgi:uncharacterized membrane protein